MNLLTSVTYCLHRLPLFFIQERHAAKMRPKVVLMSLLCTAACGLLSRFTWNLSLCFLGSEMSSLCACPKCLTGGDPWFREIINASPTLFLSRKSTTSEDTFNWWKVNVNWHNTDILQLLLLCFSVNHFRDFDWPCSKLFWTFCVSFL